MFNCRFCCNWQLAKKKFFTAVNTIYSNLGGNPELKVILSLFQSSCIPILTYGLSALSLTRAEIQSFSFTFNNLFHKLFKIANKQILEQCQFFCGVLNFPVAYDLLRFSFLHSLFVKGKMSDPDSLEADDFNDYCAINKKYRLEFTDSNRTIKFKMWPFLEQPLFLNEL